MASGPMAETDAGAVQGLLSWFKSRSGLQSKKLSLSARTLAGGKLFRYSSATELFGLCLSYVVGKGMAPTHNHYARRRTAATRHQDLR